MARAQDIEVAERDGLQPVDAGEEFLAVILAEELGRRVRRERAGQQTFNLLGRTSVSRLSPELEAAKTTRRTPASRAASSTFRVPVMPRRGALGRGRGGHAARLKLPVPVDCPAKHFLSPRGVDQVDVLVWIRAQVEHRQPMVLRSICGGPASRMPVETSFHPSERTMLTQPPDSRRTGRDRKAAGVEVLEHALPIRPGAGPRPPAQGSSERCRSSARSRA